MDIFLEDPAAKSSSIPGDRQAFHAFLADGNATRKKCPRSHWRPFQRHRRALSGFRPEQSFTLSARFTSFVGMPSLTLAGVMKCMRFVGSAGAHPRSGSDGPLSSSLLFFFRRGSLFRSCRAWADFMVFLLSAKQQRHPGDRPHAPLHT